MSENVLVSVIIPVYNTEKYLRECLDSVITQRVEGLEIVCVNDGSTDGSAEILAEYALKDNRIKVITQENQGLSGARNIGLQRAAGEYVAFLDSDDMLAENALEEMYAICAAQQLEILCYDADCFYETAELEKKEHKDEYYHRKKSYGGPMNGKVLFSEFIENDDFCDAAWVLFIKRSWLLEKQILFYPRLIHEDCLFSFQCFMETERISHIKKPFIKYRIRPNSIMTSKASYESMKGRIICYEEILRYLMKNELGKREQEAIVKFLTFIMYNIKWEDYRLDEVERDKASQAGVFERLISAGFGVGLERQYDISENMYVKGFHATLESSHKIVLYGAGKIGRRVYQYIRNQGMQDKVVCFAVSEKREQGDLLEQTPVRSILEVEPEKDMLLLISARRDFQEAMLVLAKQQGFSNIEMIDFRLEQIILGQL